MLLSKPVNTSYLWRQNTYFRRLYLCIILIEVFTIPFPFFTITRSFCSAHHVSLTVSKPIKRHLRIYISRPTPTPSSSPPSSAPTSSPSPPSPSTATPPSRTLFQFTQIYQQIIAKNASQIFCFIAREGCFSFFPIQIQF
eukprot:TRINITY_DN29070_c0_g2_i1.p1 TRINITY_DN29070_c0_g2~~TRINITY_DN29070_c0_g2_i1.p1  ORF type:complete len:140 (-),score=8.82 TRINITY_DN29070_c0_g2_i1:11-430(-)